MSEQSSNPSPDVEVDFRAFVADIPLPSPREIFDKLSDLGYVGQSEARRSLSLMAHRHVRRIKYLFVDGVHRSQLPPKDNHLLVGPTGCGKTFLVELLFRDILKLPTAIIDLTSYSETGYVGNDVPTILTRLVYAAELDVLKAQVGVVCLDEFDKIAAGQNRAVFAGAGTTKDVTGLGVQRELLKLLEKSEVPVPTAFDHSTYQQKILLHTDDIAFVACGAFSGLKSVSVARHSGPTIGFSRDGSQVDPDAIAVQYAREELDDTTVFQSYGFIPELIGRFSRIVPFAPLDQATLMQILRDQVVPARQREMALAGIDLEVNDSVLELLTTQALKRQTGARGLTASLTRHLEEAAFEAYSEPSVRQVQLVVDGGVVRSTVR